MNPAIAVFKRELKAYFNTPLAYVFLAVFLLVGAYLLFSGDFFMRGEASMAPFFEKLPTLFVIYAPLIAMRMWSEERRTGTIEMLLTLPITTWQAVLGKFLAGWVFIGISLVMTLPVFFTIVYLGSPEWGPVFTGYFGAFLLGGTYLAISAFFSVLTKSQVISFVLSAIVCGLFLIIGHPSVLGMIELSAPQFFTRICEALSFATQFDVMQRGMIELRNILFMVTVTGGFLIASSVMLDDRKAA